MEEAPPGGPGPSGTVIAGIVASRNGDLATRNVRHFDDLDIRVINPWAQ